MGSSFPNRFSGSGCDGIFFPKSLSPLYALFTSYRVSWRHQGSAKVHGTAGKGRFARGFIPTKRIRGIGRLIPGRLRRVAEATPTL
jgi:hypothetical protein